MPLNYLYKLKPNFITKAVRVSLIFRIISILKINAKIHSIKCKLLRNFLFQKITNKEVTTMATSTNERIIKISSIFVRLEKKMTKKPKLSFSGNWLKNAGFDIGENVSVLVLENQLIITKK